MSDDPSTWTKGQDVIVREGERRALAVLRRHIPEMRAWYAETDRGMLLYDYDDIHPQPTTKESP